MNNEPSLHHGDWLASSITGEKLYRYRCEPIRHLARHGYRRQASHSMRYPRTLRSVRFALAHAEEGIRVRANGNLHLPNAWDDLWSRGQKCWKEYRRRQYR